MDKLIYFIFFLPGIFLLSCKPGQPQKKTAVSPELEQQYLEKGMAITGMVFQNLSGKLKAALTSGGVSGAVEYCNLAASPLVDSLSEANMVRIKRTSHRLRNPQNAPTIQEKMIIDDYLTMIGAEELPSPQVIFEDRKVHYYAPIFLMDNCLKCHGTRNQDIAESDYEIISRLYPEDKAYDFKAGELRGIWSLEFDRVE